MIKGGLPITGRFINIENCLRRVRGFTVIEVLIVLAVTGLLFTSAALLISGRQNQAAFDQAIQQVQSQIQQVINEVATGYFPDNNFRCVAGASGPDISAVASAGQGTNSGCIFLGKAMQFDIQGTVPEVFSTYTIAGLQQRADGQESQNLNDAKPVAITANGVNLTQDRILQNGLTTGRMWYNDGGADQNIGEVAFTNSLDSLDTATGSLKSGTQHVNIIPVYGTALNTPKQAGIDAINSVNFRNPALSPENPSGGVFICFVSGGTKQIGIIKIGGQNRDLSVTLSIKSAASC